MNKLLKRLLIGAVAVLLIFAAVLAVWIFLILPQIGKNNEISETDSSPKLQSLAEQDEHIDYREEDGQLYLNNEIVLLAKTDAEESEIRGLADRLGAKLDATMADIGVYRLLFDKAMSYEELERTLASLKKNKLVSDAYLSTITEIGEDEEETEIEERAPFYPTDDWNGDGWNTEVPRGENWGMEAIDAPGAWGWLDELSPMRVGLIDTVPYTAHSDLTGFVDSTCLFIDTETGLVQEDLYSIKADKHGTHVSGIMAADWNNGKGVAGVMGGKGSLYHSALYYVTKGKVQSRYGTAYSYLLCLKKLIDQDVRVINISQNTCRLIGFAASRGNQNAINYLTQQAKLAEAGLSRIISARRREGKSDFVICVAAGNSNDTYYYPDENEPYGYRENMSLWECIKSLFGWRGERGNSLALYNNFLNLMSEPSVKDRVIVVGAVGVDQSASTAKSTRYQYASYSNVGSRVDVSAPGSYVYSCMDTGGCAYLSGTSMATPHVSGVAGLIFAANPNLSGPDVKNILLSTTRGRFVYYEGSSGMVNAKAAVINALKTREKPVEKVLKNEKDSGLDLCFVVDTTASMGDDIQNARDNMTEILEHLRDKTSDYRVALIDYRDYPSRSRDTRDYPYKVQLSFSSSDSAIRQAINDLELGNGGDTKETVYSGLMAAVRLNWRSDAKKVVIILGDAAPLEPEPESGFTYESVLRALSRADISVDYDDSDERVVDSLDASLINVYSIGTGTSSDASDFFREISGDTGGSYAEVSDASEVGDAIIDSIEQIEMIQLVSVNVDFGDSLGDRSIDLYQDGAYLFTVKTDASGKVRLNSVEADFYRWKCPEAMVGGSIEVESGEKSASARMTQQYWFAPILSLWDAHKGEILLITAGAVLLFALLIPAILRKLAARKRRPPKQKQPKQKASKRKAAEQGGFCPNCGAPLIGTGDFCIQCGEKIKKE